MNDKRTKPGWLFWVVTAPLALAVLYVWGYFAMGSVALGGHRYVRVFNAPWKAQVYKPMATVESIFSPKPVRTDYIPDP